MKSKAVLSCLSLDCPERFSLCCKAICKSASEPERMLGVPAFFCSKCGKDWEAPACTARERNLENSEWVKRFNKKFLNPDKFSAIQLHPKYQNGKGDLFGDIKEFINNELFLAQIETIKMLKEN